MPLGALIGILLEAVHAIGVLQYNSIRQLLGHGLGDSSDYCQFSMMFDGRDGTR